MPENRSSSADTGSKEGGVPGMAMYALAARTSSGLTPPMSEVQTAAGADGSGRKRLQIEHSASLCPRRCAE